MGRPAKHSASLSVAGLFAGIGGIEVGLHRAGHSTEFLCEIDPAAQAILRHHFSSLPLEPDVRNVRSLPRVSVLAAGFPCQDLSQAGRTAGIGGRNSGLVGEVFRLIDTSPWLEWVLLENVSFMLQLDRGAAMRYLVREFSDRGFMWAYRVVDTRAFGIPQRRQRVLMLASRHHDPREVVLRGDEYEPEWPDPDSVACGFYWTEGTRGLGWAVDAIPTLKGGSTIGIPSPPAIRLTNRSIVVPEIRDAERLQGFPADWTAAACEVSKRVGTRWKLVGNAVSVPVAQWIGERLKDPTPYDASEDSLLTSRPWPRSAWGDSRGTYATQVGSWPVRSHHRHLDEFLKYPTKPLSARATAGFLRRARASSLHFVDGFLDDVEAHLRSVSAPTLFVEAA
jgi:DNA (cytosine-5)-methyltransferase 1